MLMNLRRSDHCASCSCQRALRLNMPLRAFRPLPGFERFEPFSRDLTGGDVQPIPDIEGGHAHDQGCQLLFVIATPPPPKRRRERDRTDPNGSKISRWSCSAGGIADWCAGFVARTSNEGTPASQVAWFVRLICNLVST